MTKVKVTKKNNHIIIVEASGHTGYGVSGEDIVCASISSILQTAVLGVLKVAGVNARFQKNDETGYLKLELPKNLSEKEVIEVDAILNTMLAGVIDLAESYSNFIELEVLDNVY